MHRFKKNSSSLPINVVNIARIIEKRRQLYEAQAELNLRKDHVANQILVFNQREQQLKEKDLQLEEDARQHEQILKERKAELAIASNRILDKSEEYHRKEIEFKRMELLIQEKVSEEQDIKRQLDENRKYYDLMLQVAQAIVPETYASEDVIEFMQSCRQKWIAGSLTE